MRQAAESGDPAAVTKPLRTQFSHPLSGLDPACLRATAGMKRDLSMMFAIQAKSRHCV